MGYIIICGDCFPAFMFNNPKGEQEALNEACIEVIYDPETKSGSTKKTYCGGVAKPILYLYPEKTTKVTVEFLCVTLWNNLKKYATIMEMLHRIEIAGDIVTFFQRYL